MRTKKSVRDRLSLVMCLLVGAQGCIADGVASSEHLEDEADASVADLDDAQLEDKANEDALATEVLVSRVAAMPDKTVVVFDFDDTLRDHVDGQSSRWATYAESAISHLKKAGIAISVCSRNKNSSGSLNRSLQGLDSQVFNAAFFKSPAFQTDTGLDKSDDIRQIMAHFGIKRDSQVIFFDDDEGNLERVNAATDVIAIMVNDNGIDRNEFRDGMIKRLTSSGGGTPGSCNGMCSSSCRCAEGQGDCDSNADCASGLICPADGAGSELCTKAPVSNPGTCANQCSSTCRCSEGQGDCDSNEDCASGLVCPPDGAGTEVCTKPSGDGGAATGTGNLRVQVGGRWVSVGCGSGAPRADGSSDKWQIIDRKLRNEKGVYLFCDEGWTDGRDCVCSTGSSEGYHAIGRADFNVDASARTLGNALTENLTARGTVYIFPNNGHEFCLAVGSNNIIENKDGGNDGNHHESTHAGKCPQWCLGSGCP